MSFAVGVLWLRSTRVVGVTVMCRLEPQRFLNRIQRERTVTVVKTVVLALLPNSDLRNAFNCMATNVAGSWDAYHEEIVAFTRVGKWRKLCDAAIA